MSAAGLFLLRAAVGLIAIFQGCGYFTGYDSSPLWMWPVGLFTLLSGVALFLGLMTAIGSALIALGTIGVACSWLPAPTPNLLDAALPAILVIVMAVALALLGPGALSIDARLFGLREITLPRMPSSRR